jgi:hypothetical protein
MVIGTYYHYLLLEATLSVLVSKDPTYAKTAFDF